MSRIALLTVVLLAGCVGQASIDRPDIVADLACETAHMAVRLAAEIPPAPKGDTCENCDGKGKVRSGDGISVFTCPICKGTGKKVKP